MTLPNFLVRKTFKATEKLQKQYNKFLLLKLLRLTILKNQLALFVCVYFWDLSSVLLMCRFLCQYHIVLITVAIY